MKYYLVALFDNDTCANMEFMQKDVCQKHKIYRNLPILHITLEVVDDPNIEVLSNIITDIIKPYKKFKFCSSNMICFNSFSKSIDLKIQNQGYIIRIAKKINEKLKEKGFKVKESTDNYDLHVSLANINYIIKDWNNKEYEEIYREAEKKGFKGTGKIDRIELWKSINNKKDMIVKSYPLREY